MTITEMHRAFKLGLDKLDGVNYPNFRSEEIDLILNQAQNRYAKQRYGINNIKRQSFEETQKRTSDLSNLVIYANLVNIAQNPFYEQLDNIQTAYYQVPADFWFSLSERILITKPNCPTQSVPIIASTHNEINSRLIDPFHRPNNTKVFRVYASNVNAGVDSSVLHIFADANVQIGNVQLAYLAQYVKLRGQWDALQQAAIVGFPFTYQVFNPTLPNYWANLVFWFNLQTHQEIVDLAVKAALEVIEHPRYQSHTQEIINHE
jgi:hypothetical protein